MRAYRRSFRISLFTLAPLLLLPLLGGCLERMDVMDARLENLETRARELDAAYKTQSERVDEVEAELAQAWSSIFCGEKLVQMFDDIDKECSKPKEANATQASVAPAQRQAGAPDAAGASCDGGRIAPAVMDADDSHRGMLLSVMKLAPSEVIPMGTREISEYRLKRLEHLAQQRLRTTRFLVVSRTTPKEPNAEVAAAMRARVVIEHLQKWKVPEELIRRWNYNFVLSKQDAAKYQSQLRPGEPSDVNLGVWVFRVNC